MDEKELIAQRVKQYYRDGGLNCEQTTLQVLPEIFGLKAEGKDCPLALLFGEKQSAAFCKLTRGATKYICAYGREKGLSDAEAARLCSEYVREFEKRFGGLLCAKLRGKGERPCEKLVREAITMDVDFIRRIRPTTR